MAVKPLADTRAGTLAELLAVRDLLVKSLAESPPQYVSALANRLIDVSDRITDMRADDRARRRHVQRIADEPFDPYNDPRFANADTAIPDELIDYNDI